MLLILLMFGDGYEGSEDPMSTFIDGSVVFNV